MIKLQEMTPEVYYKQSRDFQFIGRLYDLVLNSVKTNADTIYNLPFGQNSDAQLLDLLTLTMGFKPKHNYNVQQLTALCSAFAEALKNKGSIKSIELATTALLHANGIKDSPLIEYDQENRLVTIYITAELDELTLLYDLFDYILPAGISAELVQTIKIDMPDITDKIHTTDNVNFTENLAEADLNKIPQIGSDDKYIDYKDKTITRLSNIINTNKEE